MMLQGSISNAAMYSLASIVVFALLMVISLTTFTLIICTPFSTPTPTWSVVEAVIFDCSKARVIALSKRNILAVSLFYPSFGFSKVNRTLENDVVSFVDGNRSIWVGIDAFAAAFFGVRNWSIAWAAKQMLMQIQWLNWSRNVSSSLRWKEKVNKRKSETVTNPMILMPVGL